MKFKSLGCLGLWSRGVGYFAALMSRNYLFGIENYVKLENPWTTMLIIIIIIYFFV